MQVGGNITYNGYGFGECVVGRTAAYVDQVRPTAAAFAATSQPRCFAWQHAARTRTGGVHADTRRQHSGLSAGVLH
jgi:hypothetical protein